MSNHSMKPLFLLVIMILHYMTEQFCPLNCSRNLPYICVSNSLSSPSLEKTIREEIKSRFSVCYFDLETNMSFKVNLDSSAFPLELDRPTIVVALLECEDDTDFYENLQPARKAWNIYGKHEILVSKALPSPHLESAVLLDSFASTGINGNPKVLSPPNTPRAEEFPSLSPNWSAEY
uniref:Acid phosphatase n=1 Tax=Heterorhabditis bacteriophora TaxID=37862 RepID=A0A1I7WD31_HETBA